MALILQVRDNVRAAIARQMQKVSDELSSGRCADWPDYKRHVGVLQGLKRALESVDEVFHKLDNEGD